MESNIYWLLRAKFELFRKEFCGRFAKRHFIFFVLLKAIWSNLKNTWQNLRWWQLLVQSLFLMSVQLVDKKFCTQSEDQGVINVLQVQMNIRNCSHTGFISSFRACAFLSCEILERLQPYLWFPRFSVAHNRKMHRPNFAWQQSRVFRLI